MRKMICLWRLTVLFAFSTSKAAADEKSHRKAAEDLLKVMKVDQNLDATIDQLLDVQVKANPQLAQVRNVLKQFLTKYLSFASLKEDYLKIYMEEFTEDELKQLMAFYQTPVGKKTIDSLPRLAAKGAQLGMERVQTHQEELQKAIEEELKKKQLER